MSIASIAAGGWIAAESALERLQGLKSAQFTPKLAALPLGLFGKYFIF